VLGDSSNTGVKHEVASGKVGRLPLSAFFHVCGIASIVMYMGVLLVKAFEASILVTPPLHVVGPMIVHSIIDCNMVALMTFPREI
jgi:hypothetical protein